MDLNFFDKSKLFFPCLGTDNLILNFVSLTASVSDMKLILLSAQSLVSEGGRHKSWLGSALSYLRGARTRPHKWTK